MEEKKLTSRNKGNRRLGLETAQQAQSEGKKNSKNKVERKIQTIAIQ